MRTTITLDEKLVSELVKITGAKTKTEAVTSAVREQIRMIKLKKLSDLLGTVDIDEKEIEKADSLDLNRAKWLDNMGGNSAK